MQVNVLSKINQVLLIFVLLLSSKAFSLQIYRTGSSDDAKVQVTPLVCLAGGGNESWAAGWKEILSSTHSGDILIIRADGRRGDYESWIYEDTSQLQFPKVNSVSTLVVESVEDANTQEVEQLINESEMIFFVGGYQDIYYSFFNNTVLQKTIKKKMQLGKVSVAGSSAGMAILGGITFLARYNSPSNIETGFITSEDAMKHPTDPIVDLTVDFMGAPGMEGIITETHLLQRNRQGRMMSFMARAVYNYSPQVTAENVRSIGLDVNTAFCYSRSGVGKVYGLGTAMFAQGNAPIERITPGSSLHWYANKQAVKAYIITADSSQNYFDLNSWHGQGGHDEFWWVDGSIPENPQFGSRR